MQKIIQQSKYSIPLGIALIVISYLLAGGYERAVPAYDSYYGCKFGAVDSLTFIQPHGRIENYSHYEALGCLPLLYFLLYAIAILGVVMSAWGLVTTGKRFLNQEQAQKEGCFSCLFVFMAPPIMILVGSLMLHPRISFGFGDGIFTLEDVFVKIAETLIIMGLLFVLIGITWAFTAVLRGNNKD